MPVPCSTDAGPPAVGELTVSQAKEAYADIHFEPRAVWVTLVANGFSDWAKVDPDLASLGLSDVKQFDIEVPREGCRFSESAPTVYTCQLFAPAEPKAPTLRVRFNGANGRTDKVLELTDVPAGGGWQVYSIDESLAYERVTSANGERRSWSLTMAITIRSDSRWVFFRHEFHGEDLE
jgi:hypothetical protein